MIYSSSRSRDKLHYPEDNCLPVHELIARKAGKPLSAQLFFAAEDEQKCYPLEKLFSSFSSGKLLYHIPFIIFLIIHIKYGLYERNMNFDLRKRI